MKITTKSRVTVYSELSEYQQQRVDFGDVLIWVAEDENYEPVFESHDLTKVIEFSNKNMSVTHISKYTLE